MKKIEIEVNLIDRETNNIVTSFKSGKNINNRILEKLYTSIESSEYCSVLPHIKGKFVSLRIPIYSLKNNEKPSP